MELELLINDLMLEDYNSALSVNIEWISNFRDIKLNNILGIDDVWPEIIELDITKKSDTSIYIVLGNGSVSNLNIVNLKEVCAVVEVIKFTLKEKKIKKINIKLKVLTTHNGKVVTSLLDNGFNFSINQVLFRNHLHFVLDTLTNEEFREQQLNKILNFEI